MWTSKCKDPMILVVALSILEPFSVPEEFQCFYPIVFYYKFMQVSHSVGLIVAS